MSQTITVTVRDHTAEAPWGCGPTTPVIRTVVISAACPRCGAPRGARRGRHQCDDGAWYWTEVWTNPCGHVDLYADVIREAGALGPHRVALRLLPGGQTLSTWDAQCGRPMTAVQASALLLTIRRRRPELVMPQTRFYLSVEPITIGAST